VVLDPLLSQLAGSGDDAFTQQLKLFAQTVQFADVIVFYGSPHPGSDVMERFCAAAQFFKQRPILTSNLSRVGRSIFGHWGWAIVHLMIRSFASATVS
jgi:hypothetical protein